MAMISEILDDWFLNPDEVTLIKRNKKTLLTLPKGYTLPTKTYIFCNGMTLKIVNESIFTIKDIKEKPDYKMFQNYGIKTYVVNATGDHPELLLYAYIKYENQLDISYKNSQDAIVHHLSEFEKYDEDEQITFYEIKYINS